MENLTPGGLWTAFVVLVGLASVFVVIANAFEKFINLRKAAKAPSVELNDRVDALEDWREEIDRKLDNDQKRLDAIEGGNQASLHALLALLDHGIDGNNIKQMQDAKETLLVHLIDRKGV